MGTAINNTNLRIDQIRVIAANNQKDIQDLRTQPTDDIRPSTPIEPTEETIKENKQPIPETE